MPLDRRQLPPDHAISSPRTRALAGFDTDREAFVGRGRDLANPLVVETGKPTNSLAAARQQHRLALPRAHAGARARRSRSSSCWASPTSRSDRPVVARYREPASVEAAFEALRADWDDYLGRFTVETPDPEMQRDAERLEPDPVPHDALLVALRLGLRDRDSAAAWARATRRRTRWAPSTTRPSTRAGRLDMLWHLQFQDGHTWHQVLPLTGEGGPGLAAEFPEWPQWFCDDHLWLVLGDLRLPAGDRRLRLPRRRRSPTGTAASDTVWGHMLRAVDFTLDAPRPARPAAARLLRLGRHDEPRPRQRQGRERLVRPAVLPRRARPGRAVPVTSAGRTKRRASARCTPRWPRIVNAVAWDGAWYARAYDDEGQPVGVQREEKHRIGLNTQTWAVIGEVGPPERAAAGHGERPREAEQPVRAAR